MANGTCSVDGCDNSIKGRGYCSKHIQRVRKYGTPHLPPKQVKREGCIYGCEAHHEWCHFPDCGRPAICRGLCNGHNIQHRAGEELRPIKSKRPNGSVGTTPCAFEGCGRPDWKRGYCDSHYTQISKGRPLGPIKVYKPGGIHTSCIRDDEGRKRCPTCDTWQPESNFHRSRRELDGLAHACKACGAKQGRRGVYKRYNITVEQYDAMLAAQGGVCAVCRQECSRGHLAVDHDHACCPGMTSCGKCVRGLLCRSCNQALGHMKDDADRLEAAAAYLRAS